MTAPRRDFVDTGKRQHHDVALANVAIWEKKPLLRHVYRQFYRLIERNLVRDSGGRTIELGSGIGKIREVIPDCWCTDLFPFPWLDAVENVYDLSFGDGEVSNIIMFDTFEHFRHPGSALAECHRVLRPGGRVLIFEPYISLLGWVVYGIFHDEPVAMKDPIVWTAPPDFGLEKDGYYTALSNAMRVFHRREFPLPGWDTRKIIRLSAISYVLCGGYGKPSFYPESLLKAMQSLDAVCDLIPSLAATRMLAVLAKRSGAPC